MASSLRTTLTSAVFVGVSVPALGGSFSILSDGSYVEAVVSLDGEDDGQRVNSAGNGNFSEEAFAQLLFVNEDNPAFDLGIFNGEAGLDLITSPSLISATGRALAGYTINGNHTGSTSAASVADVFFNLDRRSQLYIEAEFFWFFDSDSSIAVTITDASDNLLYVFDTCDFTGSQFSYSDEVALVLDAGDYRFQAAAFSEPEIIADDFINALGRPNYSASIAISPIPEPSSTMLLGILLATRGRRC